MILRQTVRSDLPLAQSAPGRLLPWLTGGLIYLVVVTLGIAMIADRVVLAFDEHARPMTVTLPLDGDAGRDLDAALEVLYGSPAVIAAAPVSNAELRTLMAPWLGENRAGDLPLPAMIDVMLDPASDRDLAPLEQALRAVVPDASVAIAAASPDRAREMAALVRGWSGLAAFLALTSALAAIGALTLLGLQLCRDTVELLRAMGATAGYLADQLERDVRSAGLRGAACGLVLALVTVVALLYSARSLAIAGAIELGLRPLDWMLLAGVAGTGLLLAVAVVRATAYWRLQQAG